MPRPDVTALRYLDLELDGERAPLASCTLDDAEMPARLAEWRALRERSTAVRQTNGGAALTLAEGEALPAVVDLIDRESGCCAFYRFSLRIAAGARELEIDAGPDGYPAVAALLSLD
jgi:hypothetical protein